MNDLHPMNSNQLQDPGQLPDALKHQLHRRRKIRRLKLSSGALIAAIAFVGVSATLLPTTQSLETPNSLPNNTTALTINDPIFDQLDSSNTPDIDTNRWRADRFLRDDWTLEM